VVQQQTRGAPRAEQFVGRGSKTPLSARAPSASAALVVLHVPARGEAHGDGEAALLRLVETLVQRLLGVGQPAQRRRAGGQRIGAIA
jgi:hypothetical protein